MNVLLFQVIFVRLYVSFSRKSCQPFFVYVESQGADPAEKDIYSKIELESID